MATHDATSSWSGYQYQGKVSLFVFLRIVNELIVDGKVEEINKYRLEIEHLEDFAIKREENYISAHQVKAKTSANTINGYIEAIDNLYNNQNGIDNYLHTIKEINNWSEDDFKNTLDNKINNLREKADKLSKEGKVKEEQVCEQDILKFSYMKSNANSIMSKVKLYQYNTGKRYCDLEEIENLIINEVKEYYQKVGQNYKTGEIHTETVYINFIGKIDKHIRDRHLKRVSKEIPFTELIEILNDDSLLERDEEYHIFNLKEIYQYREKEMFCNICIYEKGECINSRGCYVDKIINDVKSMDLNEFAYFIRRINPQISADVINDKNRDKFAQRIGIQSFFKIINRIDKQYQYQNQKVVYNESSNAYMPTTISTDGISSEYYKEAICKDIISNEEFLEDLQESNILITKDITKENILKGFRDAPEVDISRREELDKMIDKDIFTKIVSLKDLNSVVKEFKND